jgi:hypothetical protein
MKQMLVVSATYSHDNLATLQKYMVDPLLIRPEDATRPLLGKWSNHCNVLFRKILNSYSPNN